MAKGQAPNTIVTFAVVIAAVLILGLWYTDVLVKTSTPQDQLANNLARVQASFNLGCQTDHLETIIDIDFERGQLIASGEQLCLELPSAAIACVPILCDMGPEQVVNFTLTERINLTVEDGTYFLSSTK